MKDKTFVAIGLFTLGIAVMMAMETESPIDLFVALVLGGLVGHRLKLQERLDALQASFQGASGFIEALMLFCLGSMTLVGCMEDGLLHKPDLLIVKGTMDLISSAFLAATLRYESARSSPLTALTDANWTKSRGSFGVREG